ncbi:unnamed protein product [Lampetra fluviatilis]
MDRRLTGEGAAVVVEVMTRKPQTLPDSADRKVFDPRPRDPEGNARWHIAVLSNLLKSLVRAEDRSGEKKKTARLILNAVAVALLFGALGTLRREAALPATRSSSKGAAQLEVEISCHREGEEGIGAHDLFAQRWTEVVPGPANALAGAAEDGLSVKQGNASECSSQLRRAVGAKRPTRSGGAGFCRSHFDRALIYGAAVAPSQPSITAGSVWRYEAGPQLVIGECGPRVPLATNRRTDRLAVRPIARDATAPGVIEAS